MAPYYGQGSTTSRLESHFDEVVYFLPLSSQKLLLLINSTTLKTDRILYINHLKLENLYGQLMNSSCEFAD